LLKTVVNVPTGSNKQIKLIKKPNFLESQKPLTKRAGSVIQSTDPRIRIRLKVSRIRNTAQKWDIMYNAGNWMMFIIP